MFEHTRLHAHRPTNCAASASPVPSGAPVNAEGVTQEWLSSVIGSPIASFSLTSTGAAGFVSDTFRAKLTYQTPVNRTSARTPRDGAPSSVVLKFAGEADSKRFLADGLGAYVQERFAYEEIPAEMIGVRVPKIYGCFTDVTDVTD
jgi:hypothetical protein